MKRFLLIAILAAPLFFIYNTADAQRGRYYRSYPMYRSRPMVSVGIGTGFYGPRIWSSVWGPRVGVNVGIVVPPPGSRVRGLPPGATKTEINGITYYQHNNVYFRERQEGGFETVEAPIGAKLSRLPVGAKLKKIDGKYYYEKDGTIYYKWDEDGRSSYEIVGKDGYLNSDNDIYEKDYEEPIEADQPYNEEKETLPINDDSVSENDEHTEVYTVRPQVGDQFDRLPRDSKEVNVNGKKQYVSKNDIYYKEVTVDGKTFYEVVKVK
ncbi:DUF6515 family protein [Niabella ginsengisoli]|uniref:Uncharacterized protein n=1 Tax=Niabella ginsengisoli TaxID=522298 RepID=A0ABS9SJ93_9BACT|nr:DUF6515 family protein [Niabella ginsengisoli]MCH5598447.1 hypothetical protein [Niabella ginsengisoli]